MAQNIIFKISADTSNFDEGLKKTGQAVDDVGKKTKQATGEVGGFQQAIGKIGGMVAGAFAVSSLIAFGKEVARVSAEMEGLGIRMKGIHGDTNVANHAMDRLRVMANELGLDLKSLTENYTSFVSAAKATGMEVSKAEKIFKNMAVALTGVGATGERAQRAFVALTQMIGKGSIQAEEFKQQLGEAVPQAMGWMMQATGKTSKELMKMMEQGQLTVDVLEKFSEVGFNAVAGEMAEKADSMTANFNRLGNATTEFLLAIGNSAPIVGTTKALTAFMEVSTKAIKLFQLGHTDAMLEFKRLEQQGIATNAVQKISNELTEQGLSAQQQDAKFKQLRADGMRKEVDDTKMLIATQEKLNKLELDMGNRAPRAGEREFVLELRNRVVTLKESIQVQSIMNDELRNKIQLLNDSSSATGGSVKKTQEQIQAEKEMLKLMREVDAMRRRASLALADETSKIRLRQQYAEEDLQANPAFQKLDKKEQDAIIQEGRDLSQAQIDAIISNRQENEKKSQEALKKILTFEPKSAKEIADSHTPELPKDYKEDIDKKDKAEKASEEDKQKYRIEMAMQTFDLLSALNARYTQSQTQQLQEQLQQGVISQEAYEAQMRKIKRRQAVIDKAGALFSIGLNTAINATSKPALAPLIIAFGAMQAATVLASPIPYNKGTKKVPMVRGAVRGKDSVHAILTPNERVVPEDINTQPGYSALMDLAHDRKISDKEAGFIAKLATGGVYASQQGSGEIDYNQLGKSIAKYIPHTDVRIDHNGIAVITDRSHANMNRLKTRL
jgi:tape measure domain-containing protein